METRVHALWIPAGSSLSGSIPDQPASSVHVYSLLHGRPQRMNGPLKLAQLATSHDVWMNKLMKSCLIKVIKAPPHPHTPTPTHTHAQWQFAWLHHWWVSPTWASPFPPPSDLQTESSRLRKWQHNFDVCVCVWVGGGGEGGGGDSFDPNQTIQLPLFASYPLA